MKTVKLAAVLFAVALFVTMMAGCGGSSDSTGPVTPPTPPAPFSPVVHNGYSVYLVGGQYDASYLPQTAADSFTVAPGAYRPVTLRQSEIGTAMMNTAGGINWQSSFTDANGTTVSPTPSGWVLGPGTYTGVTPNPGGGNIAFTVNVIADTLGGLKVKMIACDLTGNRFPRATDGHYQIPCFTTYQWVAEWSRNGAVVTQSRYNAYASTISGSENLTWIDGGYQGKAVSVVTYAVYVYDNTSAPEMGGGGSSMTVDTITVDFFYQQ